MRGISVFAELAGSDPNRDPPESMRYNIRMFRKIVLSFVIFNNFISNLVKRRKAKWKLSGNCNKCGKCCRNIALKIEPRLLTRKVIPELRIVRWVSWLYNFRLLSIDLQKSQLVFRCANLKPDGTCKDYKWRPNMCRNYPLVDCLKEPVLIEGCGYEAIQK